MCRYVPPHFRPRCDFVFREIPMHLRVPHSARFVALRTVLLVPLMAQDTTQWNTLAQQVSSLINQGRYAEAMPLARKTLTVAQTSFSTRSLQYAMSLNGVGYLELATGDLNAAQPDLERAATLVIASAGPSSVQAITPLVNLGNLYIQQAQRQSLNPPLAKGFLSKAETSMRQVLGIAEINFKAADVNLAAPIQALAQVLSFESKFPEAIQLEKRLLAINQANLPPDNPQILKVRADLATAILASGDKATALMQLQGILPDAKRIMGVGDPFTGMIQDLINQLSGTT